MYAPVLVLYTSLLSFFHLSLMLLLFWDSICYAHRYVLVLVLYD